MLVEQTPKALKAIVNDTGNSLHALAQNAKISYSTVHAWSTGKVKPKFDTLNRFATANGYEFHLKRTPTES